MKGPGWLVLADLLRRSSEPEPAPKEGRHMKRTIIALAAVVVFTAGIAVATGMAE